MARYAVQQTLQREVIETAPFDAIAEAHEFGVGQIRLAHPNVGGELHIKHMRAKVEVVKTGDGEEYGDLVYLPDDSDEWTVLVIRMEVDVDD